MWVIVSGTTETSPAARGFALFTADPARIARGGVGVAAFAVNELP
jgi:hypothetical protein